MIRPSAPYPLVAFSCLLGLAAAACSSFQPAPTPLPNATATPAATATATLKPTFTRLPTSTPNLSATQAVDKMVSRLNDYVKAGYISSTDGSYSMLSDYSDSWAQIDYFQWFPTGRQPKDFILRTDMSWSTASDRAEPDSGCGFVFHETDQKDYYVVNLGLDGYVYSAIVRTYYESMGRGYYGKIDVPGEANFTLIVQGNRFDVLINDQFVKTYTGSQSTAASGGLGFTIMSGTNKGFGTRCEFKNVELWTLK
jgi:hypothetical protein